MARPASLFHRNFQALLWVSFSLLAVLPILAIFRIWLLFYEAAGSTLATVEIGALIAFVAASLACGFVVLRSFGSTLRHLSETSAALDRLAPPALHAGAKPDEIRIQNELISLTQSLNRIHSEFSKNMEEARNQAQFLENLQNVMSHSSDMILILDSKNHITFSNRAAREKLGLLPDQNMRHALAEGLLGAEDGRRIAAILEAWTPVDEDLVCARATGGSLHIHCILTIVENDGGKNRSKIVVLRDFTERKRMERQLYRSEQLAALGQLISGVAHELNNPLSAVLGFSELCRDPRISKEELEHNLNILEREASRTACIVENLLNFSRQRTNRRGPADVHELLERCFSLLSYNFRTNSIAVQRRYAESIPVMELDEYQIQQVFMNLIINAVQAMRDARVIAPQITVATSVCNDGRELLIEIADNGPGIPPHLLPHIFDPFFTTKSDDQGTGLGLTVSQEIIRSHGGDVSVKTEVGKGSRFSIRLPIGAGAGKRTVPDERKNASTAAATGTRGFVLVVDDEPAVLEMTVAALRRHGWSTTASGSIADAGEKIRRQTPDLIICDVCMPDGDGIALWEQLKRTHSDIAGRFLFVTGDPMTARKLQALAGTPPVLVKPFHLDELCRMASAIAPAEAVR